MQKLMLVEDNQAVRESLNLALNGDFEIFQAQSGEEALSRLDDEQPDVILLDQRLEGLSGTQFMERLAGREQRHPVVFFSAALDMRLARQAMKLGASDCVPKPSTLALLREKLMKAAACPPPRREPQIPFFLVVARMLNQLAGSGNTEEAGLEERVTGFMRGLLKEALLFSDGDSTRAAERLGLDTQEFRALQQRLGKEGDYALGAPAAC